jgi:hypothetical protein
VAGELGLARRIHLKLDVLNGIAAVEALEDLDDLDEVERGKYGARADPYNEKGKKQHCDPRPSAPPHSA